MSLKKHCLYNLNWSCFEHMVTCANITVSHCVTAVCLNGNFFCVFECTIVNLLRVGNLQMLLEIGSSKRKKKQKQNQTKAKKKKSKLH